MTTIVIPKKIFNNFANVSFINNLDRQSREGYVFKLYSGLIDWVSQNQTIVTTLTIEAKLLTILHAGKQAIW